MISIESLITEVCGILKASKNMQDVTFLPEFPAVKQDLPLKYPVVSIGVDEINAEPVENATKLEIGASPCTAKLKLLLCVPKSHSGSSCYRVLDKVIGACYSLVNRYDVLWLKTGEMKYSKVITGLVLPLDIVISVGNAFTVK